MLTSKQRAQLRGIGQTIDPIINIGKAGLLPEITESLDLALEAREIVKINVLPNCAEDIKVIAGALADRTHSELVQVIGKKIVVYRKSRKNSRITLVKQ